MKVILSTLFFLSALGGTVSVQAATEDDVRPPTEFRTRWVCFAQHAGRGESRRYVGRDFQYWRAWREAIRECREDHRRSPQRCYVRNCFRSPRG